VAAAIDFIGLSSATDEEWGSRGRFGNDHFFMSPSSKPENTQDFGGQFGFVWSGVSEDVSVLKEDQ
jgi:hypothetical protein